MKKYNQLSREQLKKITGGKAATGGECGTEQPCPGDLCCSGYGFCGNGPNYCRYAPGAGPECGCQSGPCTDC